MSVKIIKKVIKYKNLTCNAMLFLPSTDDKAPPVSTSRCIFTHGYTASKVDLIPWASRTSDAGIPTIIFDLPGHYLGSFNEVEDLKDFKNHAYELFYEAYELLNKEISNKPGKAILGGHSLGALLSAWALEDKRFKDISRLSVAVGLGLNPSDKIHIFESTFYQKTLNVRRQLVSPSLDSDQVFAWIKDEKEKITITGHRIHLITGEDDVVVGKGGMLKLAEILERNGCVITTGEPKKLPHHQPETAASHIFSFLKSEKLF